MAGAVDSGSESTKDFRERPERRDHGGERQAIRRVEQGDLSEKQVDEIGTTLMLLDQRMTELCEQHGLSPEDLNLDLGPLGTLLPRD
ncbi:gas vesicle protein K [Streptomyces sp. NPDC001940]